MLRSLCLPQAMPDKKTMPPERLVGLIQQNVIGADATIQTPFGSRALTYADYTASGRCVGIVEDFLRRDVLPMYANTHTELSATGRQTNHYREEARAIVQYALHANPETYATLFVGTGMTGALDKLIDCLGIRLPSALDKKFNLSSLIPPEARPVVFVGHMEHHSNELPWRESIADVLVIPELPSGAMDATWLRAKLAKPAYKARPMRIVSFSAGSNVTGISADVAEIARVCNQAGAVCIADYAGAGPYVPMSVELEGGAHLDALVCSPHKFVGGPGSAGVLCVRRSLLANEVPSQPGGGTIRFVSAAGHDYADVIEQREDGGTPAILQAIRTGLAFQVRKLVTLPLAQSITGGAAQRAIERWSRHPNLYLLGADRASYFEYKKRLPIVSFNVLLPLDKDGGGAEPPSRLGPKALEKRKLLSPHFVCTVLNDLFGIQGRSGCSCAGPYAFRLWGWDEAKVARCRAIVVRHGLEAAKPGWARVNFCWAMPPDEIDFIIEAVELIATHAWKLLPLYATGWASGAYKHRAWNADEQLGWICVVCAGIRLGQADFSVPAHTRTDPTTHLEQARTIFAAAPELARAYADEVLRPGGDFIEGDAGALGGPKPDADAVDWMYSRYAFPSDAVRLLGLHADAPSAAARGAAAPAHKKSMLAQSAGGERMMQDAVGRFFSMMTRKDMNMFFEVVDAVHKQKKLTPLR